MFKTPSEAKLNKIVSRTITEYQTICDVLADSPAGSVKMRRVAGKISDTFSSLHDLYFLNRYADMAYSVINILYCRVEYKDNYNPLCCIILTDCYEHMDEILVALLNITSQIVDERYFEALQDHMFNAMDVYSNLVLHRICLALRKASYYASIQPEQAKQDFKFALRLIDQFMEKLASLYRVHGTRVKLPPVECTPLKVKRAIIFSGLKQLGDASNDAQLQTLELSFTEMHSINYARELAELHSAMKPFPQSIEDLPEDHEWIDQIKASRHARQFIEAHDHILPVYNELITETITDVTYPIWIVNATYLIAELMELIKVVATEVLINKPDCSDSNYSLLFRSGIELQSLLGKLPHDEKLKRLNGYHVFFSKDKLDAAKKLFDQTTEQEAKQFAEQQKRKAEQELKLKRDEQRRVAAEQAKIKSEAKLKAEQEKKIQSQREAEEQRVAAAAAKAEQDRKAAEEKMAEAKKKAELEKIAADEKLVEQQRKAEKEKQAEQKRIADLEKKAEKAKKKKQAQKARRARKVNATAKIIKQTRVAEQEKKIEDEKLIEQRISEHLEKHAEQEKLTEQARLEELARKAELVQASQARQLEQEKQLKNVLEQVTALHAQFSKGCLPIQHMSLMLEKLKKQYYSIRYLRQYKGTERESVLQQFYFLNGKVLHRNEVMARLNQHLMGNPKIAALYQKIIECAKQAGVENPIVHFYGGAVRDISMNHLTFQDLDIKVNFNMCLLEKPMNGSLKNLQQYPRLDLTWESWRIEITQYAGDIQKYAENADVTINGMFYHPVIGLTASSIALEDCSNRTLRSPDPKRLATNFEQVMRILYFAARHGFNIEPETSNAIQQLANDLLENRRNFTFSPIRASLQINKAVSHGFASSYIRLLKEYNLFYVLFPSMQACGADESIQQEINANLLVFDAMLNDESTGGIILAEDFYLCLMKPYLRWAFKNNPNEHALIENALNGLQTRLLFPGDLKSVIFKKLQQFQQELIATQNSVSSPSPS